MRKLLVWNTKIGPFYIAESQGRYHPVFEDEPLGSYASAQQAAEDLAGGHTFSISSGIDTSTLGIPDEVTEWEQIGRHSCVALKFPNDIRPGSCGNGA